MAIPWHTDLDIALAECEKAGLPLFIDFWAYG
jgi:hypothetical protein